MTKRGCMSKRLGTWRCCSNRGQKAHSIRSGMLSRQWRFYTDTLQEDEQFGLAFWGSPHWGGEAIMQRGPRTSSQFKT
eukprot:126946-Pyramimonas_sp.AAC.1